MKLGGGYSVSAAPESDFSEDDALVHFSRYDEYADKYSYAAFVNGYVQYDIAEGKLATAIDTTFFMKNDTSDSANEIFIMQYYYW